MGRSRNRTSRQRAMDATSFGLRDADDVSGMHDYWSRPRLPARTEPPPPRRRRTSQSTAPRKVLPMLEVSSKTVSLPSRQTALGVSLDQFATRVNRVRVGEDGQREEVILCSDGYYVCREGDRLRAWLLGKNEFLPLQGS